MKQLTKITLAAFAAALLALAGASSASATILEVGGTLKNESITISASIQSETKVVLSRTDGSLANECATSNVHGVTTTFITTRHNWTEINEVVTEVGGPLTGDTALEQTEGRTPEQGLNFSNCTREVKVHKSGTLEISEVGITDGTVTSKGAEVTVGSPFGTLNCKTGTGVDIGTLTGTASTLAHSKLHISAVLNCGFLVPSATWKGTYVVTSPTGLGVV